MAAHQGTPSTELCVGKGGGVGMGGLPQRPSKCTGWYFPVYALVWVIFGASTCQGRCPHML